MYVKSYKDLIVWQKAIQLVKEIYRLTAKFPPSEQYGLSLQIRKAVVSIPSNIAEGYGRKSPKEYAQHFSIAYGSALELETQVFIANELKFTAKQDFISSEQLLAEVARMLNSMTSKMKLTARR